jgi:lauroyl/myristoyl acyltransferase
MALKGLFDSKFSIQASLLIGKYLTKRAGYRLSSQIATIIANRTELDITRSIRANQFVVRGEDYSRQELIEISKGVLEHAGKCFYDLYHFYNKPEILENLVPYSESMRSFIELCADGRGYVVVAPHLSNFDLVVCGLVKHGLKAKVLSYPNPGKGYQYQNKLRQSFGMEVTPLGDSNLEGELIKYLKNGGVVATGMDRPVPGRKRRHFINFFDRPSPLSAGYITTALAADVPVIVVKSYMELDGTYGFQYADPLPMERIGNKIENIKHNAERVLKQVEIFIKETPGQWLMYYPVWPDIMNEGL